MSLFQPKVLDRHIDSVKILPEENQIIARWNEYIHNPIVKKRKETALYDSFSQGILQKVLHYKPALENPNDYTLEQNQTIGRGEVEYALGFFGKDKLQIIAPLELKSMRTNLDLVTPGRNKSPVQQAWDYATETKGTKWVLVSNYLELRLYAVGFGRKDYEVFNLENLTDPYESAHFLLLLSSERLLGGFTQELLSSIDLKDKEITKKFYAHYKKLREEIIISLKEDNSSVEFTDIIRYTQVLLDRVLFAAFAEDRGLLPLNTIMDACTPHRFNQRPLWENFKGLFDAIDKGNTTLQIPGYNGGLFHYDPKLDSLNVRDEICKKFRNLSEYDFVSDVSVNILGRILEQSISDLEEIHKINNTEIINSIEPHKSKRKKEGVYYTPSYITQYMVEEAIGGWISDRKKELGFQKLPLLTDQDYASIRRKRNGQIVYNQKIGQHIKAWESYKENLANIKVLDPACGSGAFLIEAYDYLFKEEEAVNNELSKLKGGQFELFRWDRYILTNNIFGVDINDEAIEITKLSLWLKTANKKEKLINLDQNIKCGDTLINDTRISALAFDWKKEFPEIMNCGGFDVIIGNPPYIFSREKIKESEKKYYQCQYSSSQYQINTYILFIERALQLLKDKKGHLNFIIPNSFLMISSAEKLRKILIDGCTISSITNLIGYSFELVNVETIILNLMNKSSNNNQIRIYQNNDIKEFELLNIQEQDLFKMNKGAELFIFNEKKDSILLNKLKNNSTCLNEVATVQSGLKAYQVGKGKPPQTKEDVKNRIFDYDYQYDNYSFPYLNGKDVSRYYHKLPSIYLKYGAHLAEPRSLRCFQEECLIIREITGKYPRSIIATYSSKHETLLFNISNIAVMPKEGSNIDLKYILSLMNSKLMSYYFMHTTPKAIRKMFPKIILKDLRNFPIKIISKNDQDFFINKVELMLNSNKVFFNIDSKFKELIKAELFFKKISTKLEKWYELDETTFLKELQTSKKILNISEKTEWLGYFKDQKSTICNVARQINKIDNEIDNAVYDLYGLNQQEIQLVESAF